MGGHVDRGARPGVGSARTAGGEALTCNGKHVHMIIPKPQSRSLQRNCTDLVGCRPDGSSVSLMAIPQRGERSSRSLNATNVTRFEGEPFPQTSASAGNIGPELTGMGGHHPVEYFAESILNPNAIIVTGPGYTDADGMSIMPDYRDTMTVAEFIDLVGLSAKSEGRRCTRRRGTP